jgi:hypothetical protein
MRVSFNNNKKKDESIIFTHIYKNKSNNNYKKYITRIYIYIYIYIVVVVDEYIIQILP